MLTYLPRAAQLKLFRYALSRLDILDHSTYDVEKDFNLSLGMKNVLEMKNVGLNIEKLTAMLALPPDLRLQRASISTLQIRIPADFYRAPVRIEVEGVHMSAVMIAPTASSPDIPSPGHQRQRGEHSPSLSSSLTSDMEASVQFHLPTADSLTMSFLQEMPLDAREVKSALEHAKSQPAQQSSDEDSSDEDDELGLGAPVSLWNFVPNFFRRLVDRLEVEIRTVIIKVEVPAGVQLPDVLGNYAAFPSEINGSSMSIELKMSALEVDGVTTKASAQNKPHDTPERVGKRIIRLVDLSVTLIGHPDNFIGDSPPSSQHDDESIPDFSSTKSDSTVLPAENIGPSRHDPMLSENLISSATTVRSRHEPHEDQQTPATISPGPRDSHVEQTRSVGPLSSSKPARPRASSPAPSNRSSTSSNSDDYNDQMLSQSIYVPQDDNDDNDDTLSVQTPGSDQALDESFSGLGSLTHSMLSEADRYADIDDHLEHSAHVEMRRNMVEGNLLDMRGSDLLGDEAYISHRPAPVVTGFQFDFDEPLRTDSEQRIDPPVTAEDPTFYDTEQQADRHIASGQSVHATLLPIYYDEEDDEYSDPEEHYLSQVISRSPSPSLRVEEEDDDEAVHYLPFLASTSSSQKHRNLAAQHGPFTSHMQEPHFIQLTEPVRYDEGHFSSDDDGSVYQSYPGSEADDNETISHFASGHEEKASLLPEKDQTTASSSTSGTHKVQNAPEHNLEQEVFSSIPGSSPGNSSQSLDSNTRLAPIEVEPIRDLEPEDKKDTVPNLPIGEHPTPYIENASITEPELPVLDSTRVHDAPQPQDTLSQSMLFSHEQADSLYMSAIGGMSSMQSTCGLAEHPISLVSPSATETEDRITRRVERKTFIKLNFLEVLLPGLHSEDITSPPQSEEQAFAQPAMSDSIYPNVPGGFSIYASHSAPANPSSAIHDGPKKRPEVAFAVPETENKKTSANDAKEWSGKTDTIDIIFGEGSSIVDIPVSKLLLKLGRLAMITFKNGRDLERNEISKNSKDVYTNSNDVSVDLNIQKMDIRLVEKLAGEVQTFGIRDTAGADLGSTKPEEILAIDKDDTDGETLLQLLLRDSSFSYRHESVQTSHSDNTTVKARIRKFAITDGQNELMGFVPPSADTRKSARSRKHRSDPAPVNDFLCTITETAKNRNIVIRSLPLKIFLPSKRLEEICDHFGGLGSVLSLAGSSTMPSPTIAKKPKSVQWEQVADQEPGRETVVDAEISGLVIELFVSEKIGGIGVSTTPLTIRASARQGLSIKIEQCAALGPQLSGKDASTIMSIEAIHIQFGSAPSGEDLEKLIKQVTPSKDPYDKDDNLMIDILLRQRRQGSVLRVQVGKVDGKVKNIDDLRHFSSVGDELARMATVAKYIPQDERPGMMSVVEISQVEINIIAPLKVGQLRVKVDDIEACHVGSPSLLALSVGSISATRNRDEELIGAALPHSDLATELKNILRPMIRIRMIGDEPEPVIKAKIWNLRVEYDVETLMAVLENSKDASPDFVAAEMVASIANITEKHLQKLESGQSVGTHNKIATPMTKPLLVDLVLCDTAIGLNPLVSMSKAILLVGDARFTVAVPSSTPLVADLEVKKAYLLLIDDKTKLAPASIKRPDQKRRSGVPHDELIGFTSQGYVTMITISSAKIFLKLREGQDASERFASVEIRDVFTLLESCADSTKTLISVLSGLQPPGPEGEVIKYKTEIMTMDLLASLDENAFGPRPAKSGEEGSSSPVLTKSSEAVLVDGDVPFNAQFIESYYPTHLEAGGKTMLASFHEQVSVADDDPLDFNDDHFGFVYTSKEKEKNECLPELRKSPIKVKIRNVQFIWNLHDGYDWQNTRDALSKAVKKVEGRAMDRLRRHAMDRSINFDESESDEESETYDVLFNSIYITLPQNKDPKQLGREISAQMKGGRAHDDTVSESGSYAPTTITADSQATTRRHSGKVTTGSKFQRSSRSKLQIELKGVDVDFTLYAPDENPIQSSVDLKVNEFEINDNVPTSTWRKFVTYMREAGIRETGIAMAHILVDVIKPVPDLAATELSLKVSILPLRLHVDQDSLDFLTRFFEFKDDGETPSDKKVEEPFIQRCEIDTVRVKLDFKPKRVDYAGIRSGRTTEFMNFFVLEESEMELRHTVLRGVSGFERLGKDLNDVWMPDIKKNQLPGVLAGVAPVRSLVNIGSGVRDLVRVPIMEYKKDGRIVRSIQKGAFAFAKTTTSEMVRFGAKVAIGTQTMLEKTEGFLGGETSTAQQRHYAPHRQSGDDAGPGAVYSPYAEQPMGMYRGLVDARAGITRNFGEAKEAIMRVPADAAEGGSAQSAAAAVLRAAPTAVIRPMIGVVEAVHKTLHGIDNTLDKQKRDRIKDKYKKH